MMPSYFVRQERPAPFHPPTVRPAVANHDAMNFGIR
jgi:hypothetical protein